MARGHATLFQGLRLGQQDFNKYDAAAVVENMLSFYEKAALPQDFTWGSKAP
jgi:hypothetical protein